MTRNTIAADVAVYIIEKLTSVGAMKLQKLVYYSQAWSLVWDDAPLFEDEIQAWALGPVVRSLYDSHKGHFQMTTELFPEGSSEVLSDSQKESVDVVLEAYGEKSAQWLSDLSHMERPWNKARESVGADDGDRCDAPITHEVMAEYYSSLSRAD